MPVQLGAKPEHDFADPLGLLSDCHRRIENFLQILLRVAGECEGGEMSREHREALEAALNYFRKALPRHTEDEEQSLFPRLRETEASIARDALEKVAALEADHAEADSRHARIDELGKMWLEQDRLTAPETTEFREILAELREIYSKHIDIEDNALFPAARAALDARQISEMGREMAERRGIRIE